MGHEKRQKSRRILALSAPEIGRLHPWIYGAWQAYQQQQQYFKRSDDNSSSLNNFAILLIPSGLSGFMFCLGSFLVLRDFDFLQKYFFVGEISTICHSFLHTSFPLAIKDIPNSKWKNFRIRFICGIWYLWQYFVGKD